MEIIWLMPLKEVQQIIKRRLFIQPDRDPQRKSIKRMMELLSHPERDLKFIHITGSNGKGSVALKTASILSAAGFKTGLFISPHLYTFRERIQIDGKMIEMEAIEKYLPYLDQLTES